MGVTPGGRKTFLVSVQIGLLATVWPLGRLHISDESITVRSLFKTRTSPKSQITDISLERYRMANELLFKDSGGLAGVMVFMPARAEGVLGELRRRGYPVVDRRPRLLPLPQGAGPWQGIVRWHDDDETKPPGPPAG
jgi:hypothetical protein